MIQSKLNINDENNSEVIYLKDIKTDFNTSLNKSLQLC